MIIFFKTSNTFSNKQYFNLKLRKKTPTLVRILTSMKKNNILKLQLFLILGTSNVYNGEMLGKQDDQ